MSLSDKRAQRTSEPLANRCSYLKALGHSTSRNEIRPSSRYVQEYLQTKVLTQTLASWEEQLLDHTWQP